MFNINFADDWIRTADLWYRKQPLYQLSHTTTAHLFKLNICSVSTVYRKDENKEKRPGMAHFFKKKR